MWLQVEPVKYGEDIPDINRAVWGALEWVMNQRAWVAGQKGYTGMSKV